MTKKLILTAFCVQIVCSLTGCVPQQKVVSVIDQAKYNCFQYGYQAGTDGFMQCAQNEAYRINQQKQMEEAASYERFQNQMAINNAGIQNMINSANTKKPTLQMPKQTNCTPTYGGGYNCTTY